MTSFRVAFRPVVSEAEYPTIALSPTDLSWNDFGFNFHAVARFFDPDGRDPIMMRAFVIPFNDEGMPVTHFKSWFDSRGQRADVTRAEAKGVFGPTIFNSMLASEDSYAALRDWCGTDENYNQALDAINDISWLARQDDAQKYIAQATIDSPAFRLGVIRTGSAYRAFRRGYQRGLQSDQVMLEARVPFDFTTSLAGFGSPHSLKIEYLENDLVSDRIHCIVGINGVGKSRFIGSLIEQLAANSVEDEFVLLDGDSISHSDSLPRYSRVLSYTTEQGSPIPAGFDVQSPFDYQHLSLTAPILSAEEADGGQPRAISMARMMIDLLRERELESDSTTGLVRHQAFLGAIKDHLNVDSLAIPLRKAVADGIVFSDSKGRYWAKYSELHRIGEQRKLDITGELHTEREVGFFNDEHSEISISSGQRVFLKFALHFLSFATTGMLVFLDEPETHLHPNLVSSFAVLLNKVLQATSSVAIVATHSVYMVREVPTHCNHVLRVKAGEVSFELVYLRTLGASPTSLSIALFGDDTVRQYHKQISRHIAASGLSLDEVMEKYAQVISMDMLIQIRALMASGPAEAI